MTEYVPPSLQGIPQDVYQLTGSQLARTVQPPLGPARYNTRFSKDGKSARWRVEWYDLRGALNGADQMDFEEGHTKLLTSSLESRFARHLTLPMIGVNAATPDPTVSTALRRISHVNAFGGLLIGIGASTGSLFQETSSTNPAITAAASYDAGAATSTVISLSKAVIGGISAAERVIVGHYGAGVVRPAKIVSALAGTVAATTNNGTDLLYGLVQVPLPNLPIIMYCNTSILSLLATNATGDAPTTQLSNVPSGGKVLGYSAVGNGPISVYMVWPNESQLNGAPYPTWNDGNNIDPSTFILERKQKVVRLTEYGQYAGDVKFPPLVGIGDAILVRGGIMALDYERVAYWDGRTRPFDTGFAKNRPVASDRRVVPFKFLVVADDLYVQVMEIAQGANTNPTLWWIERYDFDLNTWQAVSAEGTLTSDLLYGYATGGAGMPYSEATGFFHDYIDGTWRRQYMPPPGTNPYALRKTSGATAATGKEMTTLGDAYTPWLEIPGLQGWPKLLKRATLGGNAGDYDSGATTQGYVQIDVSGGPAIKFYAPKTSRRSQVIEVDDGHEFHLLQCHWHIVQQSGGTDPTRTTPNGLPLILEGVAFAPPDFKVNMSERKYNLSG